MADSSTPCQKHLLTQTPVEQGPDILDIGGKSRAPAPRKFAADEIARVVHLIEALAAGDTPISIDTYKAETARAAVNVERHHQ